MSDLHIELDIDVVTSDGLKFGKLHQFVVDPKTRSLPAIIVRYGHLPEQRDFIVGWQLIDEIAHTGVRLLIDGRRVERLQEVMRVANVSGPAPTGGPYISYFGGASAYAQSDFIGEAVRAEGPVVGEGGNVPLGTRTAFDMSSTNVELQTNLPENTVMVSHDTDVMTNDEKKIGKVHEAVCDGAGIIHGFVGRAGRIRHHTYYVPADLIAGGSHRYIRLKISADEAARTLPIEAPS